MATNEIKKIIQKTLMLNMSSIVKTWLQNCPDQPLLLSVLHRFHARYFP